MVPRDDSYVGRMLGAADAAGSVPEDQAVGEVAQKIPSKANFLACRGGVEGSPLLASAG